MRNTHESEVKNINVKTMAVKKTTTKKKEQAPVDTVEHVVTAEDIENNPNLVDNGIQVGDVIEVPKKVSNKVSKVVFLLKNNIRREFTLEIHGEDFVKTADQFEETNKANVLTRADI